MASDVKDGTDAAFVGGLTVGAPYDPPPRADDAAPWQWCDARVYGGTYGGYACCGEAGHVGPHFILCGRPGGGAVVVATWLQGGPL